jgi:hypothetical protein
VNENDPIRPLKDVWLRPRRVFGALDGRPLTSADFALAAVQGLASYLMIYQVKMASAQLSAQDSLSGAFIFGPIAGIIAISFSALVYRSLGQRLGARTRFAQMFHLMAYGGVPLTATLLVLVVTLLTAGDAVFNAQALHDADGFVQILLRIQRILDLLLFVWSYVLQVFGVSEYFKLSMGRAFAVWLLGQLLVGFGALLLAALLQVLLMSLGVVATPS